MRDPILVRFGLNLRGSRQRAGLSQEQLAARAQLHRTYVGGIERGERNVGLINIVKLAKALGIDPSQLTKGLPPRPM